MKKFNLILEFIYFFYFLFAMGIKFFTGYSFLVKKNIHQKIYYFLRLFFYLALFSKNIFFPLKPLALKNVFFYCISSFFQCIHVIPYFLNFFRQLKNVAIIQIFLLLKFNIVSNRIKSGNIHILFF